MPEASDVEVAQTRGGASSSDEAAEVSTNTVIVGAGPSGLAMAACLAREGVSYVLLEKADTVGPAWRNHYERLHLHTVRDHSGLPHFPMSPEKYPTYPSRDQVAEYLDDYAHTFDIAPRLSQAVESIRRDGDRWVTSTHDTRYVSERVVLATGYNRVPYRPSWEGEEQFSGEVLHSQDYRNGARFQGRKVLVVGIGNTGGEIAIDLCGHGADTTICVRSPIHVTPRDALGSPAHVTALRLAKLPNWFGDGLFRLTNKWLVGDLSHYGIRQAEGSPRESIEKHGRVPLLDIGTIDLIKQGTLKVAQGIRRFHEHTIEFVDGNVDEFDAVVLCTGYRGGIEDFLGDVSAFTDAKGYPVPPSGEAPWPGLYFLGFANPPTGFLRQIAIDAQDIARDITARVNVG